MERTLVIIKPNAVQREIIGEIISRIEKRGFKITALKMLQINKDLAAEHYREHRAREFYQELVDFITSGPCVIMILEGEKAVDIMRLVCGPTDPSKAMPGTIRGDYGIRITQNVIHASDSLEAAEREIKLFFKEDEIIEYRLAAGAWI
ncbi:Nucleoside diphosphate kinase [subsurface metagenome]